MANKIRSSEKSLEPLIDVFEAIRRAMIRHGRFRQKPKTRISTSSGADTKTAVADKHTDQSKAEAKENGPDELVDVTEKAHEILFKGDTVFPFNLFPDTITLDREKITIAKRFFFSVAKITSVPVRDILSVEADIGPFFGSIHIASRYFVTNPSVVTFLWRKDTLRLQRLLQGYIIAHERKLDCSNIPTDELIKILDDLGQGDTD
ncbi:hypothetical protein H0X09_01670 [Candidatus Saccharibacteria bacterium]|nr:hypothetical protein [Candidatus Saccharibacteria bacterium]